MTLDIVLTLAVVAGAAVYLLRKFSRTKQSGGCGCGSDGNGCGGQQQHAVGTECCSSKR